MGILFAIIGLIGAFALVSKASSHKENLQKAEKKAAELLSDAASQAEVLKKAAEEKAYFDKERMSVANKMLDTHLEKQKEVIAEKEELMSKRDARVSQLEGTIKNLDKNCTEVVKGKKELFAKTLETLSKVAGETPELVRDEMINTFFNDFENWKEARLREMDAPDYKEDVIPVAKSILKAVLQRYTDESSVDRKEYSFVLKSDDMKGPLVGPGGKHINYFEEKAECVVIFNYEPNLVIVSCLNMYKRAVAFEAIKTLSHERKIDEKIIDKHIEKAKKKIDDKVMEYGEKAAKKLGYKNLQKELLYLIGRFEFRTSYGQNIWRHSMEVAFFARMLAEEIGANVARSLDAAFYHDLGKAIDHDLETSVGHDYLSKDLMEKFSMDPLTIHAAFAHHDAVPCERPEDYIVKAADAMSASRPGARQQTMEKYSKLVSELTERAAKVEGVDRVLTMSAGREVRVFVNNQKILDADTASVAEKIAKDIEANVGYPGVIKINVIRAIEAYETAKEKVPMKRR